MTENMSVGYINIRDAPPDYRSSSDTASVSEPLIMLPIRKEIQQVEERQNRNRSLKRNICCCSVGFVLCAIVFSIAIVVWKNYGQSLLKTETSENRCQKRTVGYYKGFNGVKITEAQIEKLTHIIYNGIITKPDGRIDFENEQLRSLFLDMKSKAKTMNSNVKIMFSTDSYANDGDKVAAILSESKTRKSWIDSISSFILEHNLDGVELHYRWPNSKEDKDNYVFLARELRYKLQSMERITRRKTPYIISALGRKQNWFDKTESLIFDLLPSVDFFNVETDNFNAPWHKNGATGPLSPLYSDNQRSTDFTMKAYTCTTKLPNRFNFMVPFRGLFWKNVERPLKDDAQYRSVSMKNDSGEGVSWRNLEKEWNISSAIWDDVSRTPYILDSINRTLLTFENKRSLKEKMEYMVSNNLGGITIDTLEWDDDSNTLLKALTSIDVCSGPKFKKNEINYKCE